MKWYEKIIQIHTSVTDDVRHNQYMQSDRYFVWQEDGENAMEADGVHAAKAVTGTTDLFTKKEFDPWKEEMEQAFDASGVAWYLNSVQFEEDTGFTHYEWRWEVMDNG